MVEMDGVEPSWYAYQAYMVNRTASLWLRRQDSNPHMAVSWTAAHPLSHVGTYGSDAWNRTKNPTVNSRLLYL